MWISQQMNSSTPQHKIELGQVTLNVDNDIEAASTLVSRDVKMFAPMGYSYSVQAGDRLVLADTDSEQVSLGVLMNNSSLNSGEIKISNPFGAYIYLKNDGSVEINGLLISKGGAIVDK